MEIGNFTRGEVKDFIEKRVKDGLVSEIIGHRLILLFEQFSNIQSFLDAPEYQLLQAYRKISNSKKDLGKRTYNEHQVIKSHFKDLILKKREQEKQIEKQKKDEEEKERRENPIFTAKELQGIASLMELSGWDTVDLKKISILRDCFGLKLI